MRLKPAKITSSNAMVEIIKLRPLSLICSRKTIAITLTTKKIKAITRGILDLDINKEIEPSRKVTIIKVSNPYPIDDIKIPDIIIITENKVAMHIFCFLFIEKSIPFKKCECYSNSKNKSTFYLNFKSRDNNFPWK